MTLLAFGCSVTHGTEIAALGNSKDNLSFSYPALVAKHLGVDCVNHAFCGNSNENIFHEALEHIPKCNNITAVIVGWAADVREVWKCDGRTWQFNPGWGGTSLDLFKPYRFIQETLDPTLRCCASTESYIPIVENLHEILTRYKFDPIEYAKKTNNYINSLKAYCSVNNIKLIETCWERPIKGAINIGKIGTWFPSADNRHPTKDEHRLMAEEIIRHYEL
jgi:hypothetical protein